jgi:hypothetical protein
LKKCLSLRFLKIKPRLQRKSGTLRCSIVAVGETWARISTGMLFKNATNRSRTQPSEARPGFLQWSWAPSTTSPACWGPICARGVPGPHVVAAGSLGSPAERSRRWPYRRVGRVAGSRFCRRRAVGHHPLRSVAAARPTEAAGEYRWKRYRGCRRISHEGEPDRLNSHGSRLSNARMMPRSAAA